MAEVAMLTQSREHGTQNFEPEDSAVTKHFWELEK
jgi:hypothetical protein